MANHKVVIHLSVTRLTPVQSILSDNVTTMEVNFLSWNKAYSLFPLPTFIQYKSYLLRQWDDVTRLAAQSDSRNGWKVQGVLWPEEKHRNQPIRERRRVGDHYAWIIPFDTRKVEWSKTPDYVLEHACFTMDQISDDDNNDDDDDYTDPKDVRSYTIKATKLESAVLRYTYLCGDNRMRDFILRRFRSFTILELRMLDPAQRPANYDQILTRPWDIDGALDGFEPPASWRYRDDELPKLYEAFEKRKSE